MTELLFNEWIWSLTPLLQAESLLCSLSWFKPSQQLRTTQLLALSWDSGWPGSSTGQHGHQCTHGAEQLWGTWCHGPTHNQDKFNIAWAGLFHWLSCDQSLQQLQITPLRMSSSRWIFKNNCKQMQSDIAHSEPSVITHYKAVHYCNIPAWKGTQIALPEKQDWVLLSASHKTYLDLKKKPLLWALFAMPTVFQEQC